MIIEKCLEILRKNENIGELSWLQFIQIDKETTSIKLINECAELEELFREFGDEELIREFGLDCRITINRHSVRVEDFNFYI